MEAFWFNSQPWMLTVWNRLNFVGLTLYIVIGLMPSSVLNLFPWRWTQVLLFQILDYFFTLDNPILSSDFPISLFSLLDCFHPFTYSIMYLSQKLRELLKILYIEKKSALVSQHVSDYQLWHFRDLEASVEGSNCVFLRKVIWPWFDFRCLSTVSISI